MWAFDIPLSNAVMPPVAQGGGVGMLVIFMYVFFFLFIVVLIRILYLARKRRKRLLSKKGIKVATAIGVVIIAAVIMIVMYAFWFSPTKPITHSGDLVIGGNQTYTIQSCVYTLQDGDIIVKDNAHLVIKEATLIFDQSQEQSLTIMDNGTVNMRKATVTTRSFYGMYSEFNFSIRNHAQATIEDTWMCSPIHCYDSSRISVYNSTVEVIDHRSIDD